MKIIHFLHFTFAVNPLGEVIRQDAAKIASWPQYNLNIEFHSNPFSGLGVIDKQTQSLDEGIFRFSMTWKT